MTLVDIRKLTEQQRTLEELTARCQRLYVESEQTYRQLKNLSGMYQVRRTLEYVMEDIQEEYQLLKMMGGCLEQTCRIFVASEEYVAEHAEESKVADSTIDVLETIQIPDNIFRLLR